MNGKSIYKQFMEWICGIEPINQDLFIENFIPNMKASNSTYSRMINKGQQVSLPNYPALDDYIAFFNDNNKLVTIFNNSAYSSSNDLVSLIKENYSLNDVFYEKLNIAFTRRQFDLFLTMLSSLIVYNKVLELDNTISYESKLTKLSKGQTWTNEHLYKYLNNIILKTGISGLAGTREIQYYASQQDNPFILYEAGELEYYKRTTPDFEKALQYYRLAWDNFHFPLAAWSIGYMYMKQGTVDNLIDDTVFVTEFDMLTEVERLENAAYYFSKAAQHGCGAAFNSLGNLCKNNLQDNIWNILKIDKISKKEQWYELQEYYYKEAAKLDNVDGLYNLSRLYINKIKKGLQITRNEKEIIINNLKNAIQHNHVKALNELGLIYLHESDWDHFKQKNTPHLVEKDINYATSLLFKAAHGYGSDKWYWANYNYAKYCLTNELINVPSNVNKLNNIIENYKLVLDNSDSAIICRAKVCYELAKLYHQGFINKKKFNELTYLHINSLPLYSNTQSIYKEIIELCEGKNNEQ